MAFLKARDGSRMATEDQYRRIKAEKAKLEKALDRACKVIAVCGAGFAGWKVTELLEDNQYEDDERSRSENWKRYFLEGGE